MQSEGMGPQNVGRRRRRGECERWGIYVQRFSLGGSGTRPDRVHQRMSNEL